MNAWIDGIVYLNQKVKCLQGVACCDDIINLMFKRGIPRNDVLSYVKKDVAILCGCE